MEQEFPEMVMKVTILTLLLVIGLFIVISISTVTYDTAPSHEVETFTVTDPSQDQDLVLSFVPTKTPTVERYDGISWSAVSSTYVDWTSGTTLLTVQSGGLS